MSVLAAPSAQDLEGLGILFLEAVELWLPALWQGDLRQCHPQALVALWSTAPVSPQICGALSLHLASLLLRRARPTQLCLLSWLSTILLILSAEYSSDCSLGQLIAV